MKILYFGSIFSSDSDFPLVKKLREKGHQVKFVMPISYQYKKGGLIDIEPFRKTGIYKACSYKQMGAYQDYLDLEQTYFINQTDFRMRNIMTVLIWIKFYLMMLLWNPDILHVAWPLGKMSRILYLLPAKKVLMVHDPFKHSSNTSITQERDRVYAFKRFDKLVLLNQIQKSEFCSYYKIPSTKIMINKMGYFDYMEMLKVKSHIEKPYVLFFGYIVSYKGLEYLCQAMLEVHKKFPKLKLVIAGGGKIYFDYEPYKNLDYFILKNQYIPVDELSQLLRDCEFAVCPYKDATQSGVVQTAFSLNVPMIVTNVGALPESVVNGVTGLVIPPHSVQDIANSICDLYNNREKLETMRKNIRNIWRKNMDWNTITDKYIGVYKEIIL